MKVRCPNCGKEIDIVRLYNDEINPDGFYVSCTCGSSFDIDEEMITKQMFITDIAKMADFVVLTEEEFLETYSYLTEDEYEATRLYFDWLNTDWR